MSGNDRRGFSSGAGPSSSRYSPYKATLSTAGSVRSLSPFQFADFSLDALLSDNTTTTMNTSAASTSGSNQQQQQQQQQQQLQPQQQQQYPQHEPPSYEQTQLMRQQQQSMTGMQQTATTSTWSSPVQPASLLSMIDRNDDVIDVDDIDDIPQPLSWPSTLQTLQPHHYGPSPVQAMSMLSSAFNWMAERSAMEKSFMSARIQSLETQLASAQRECLQHREQMVLLRQHQQRIESSLSATTTMLSLGGGGQPTRTIPSMAIQTMAALTQGLRTEPIGSHYAQQYRTMAASLQPSSSVYGGHVAMGSNSNNNNNNSNCNNCNNCSNCTNNNGGRLPSMAMLFGSGNTQQMQLPGNTD